MKHNLKDILYYFQGNVRYQLFYSKFAFLLSKHIREQIELRIKTMDKTCYNTGSCVLCGCNTTALQMCNKSCDKPCYPRMLNKSEWNDFKTSSLVYIKETRLLWYLEDENTLNYIKIEENELGKQYNKSR